jgi:hypothetical protein
MDDASAAPRIDGFGSLVPPVASMCGAVQVAERVSWLTIAAVWRWSFAARPRKNVHPVRILGASIAIAQRSLPPLL